MQCHENILFLFSQEGGFYSAEDADSYPTSDATEKREGAFCVWTYERVQELLNQPVASKAEVNLADVFCYHYGVKSGGNVDPHQVANFNWLDELFQLLYFCRVC